MRHQAVALALSLNLVAATSAFAGNAGDAEFIAALQGVELQAGAMAQRMGLGAFPGVFPAEVMPPVHNPHQQRQDQARNRIAQQGLRATLTVRAGDRAQGSGFIADPSGIVFTNAHVVRIDPNHLTVETNDGRSLPARLLAAAPGRDIAILQIVSDETDWPALPLGESESLDVGHTVFALGNPTGLGLSFSQGVISRPRQPQTSFYVDHIQSDLQVSHGNSGGPLLNSRGEVVGMNSQIAGTGGRLSLSIRVEDLQAALEEYNSQGRLVDGMFSGGLMALSGRGSPFVMGTGAGPAARAGLRVGDSVLAVDGTELSGTSAERARQIMRAFGHKRPGDTVEVRVRRAEPALLVLPGAHEGEPERVAPAFVVGEDGAVFVPESAGEFLQAAAAAGGQAKVRVGGRDYPARLQSIGQDGYGIVRIAPGSGWRPGQAQEETVNVPVEPYTLEGDGTMANRLVVNG